MKRIDIVSAVMQRHKAPGGLLLTDSDERTTVSCDVKQFLRNCLTERKIKWVGNGFYR